MSTYEQISNEIDKALIDKGIKPTNVEIAERANVTEATVRNWKKGREPRVESLLLLARSLDRTLDSLFISNKPTPPNLTQPYTVRDPGVDSDPISAMAGWMAKMERKVALLEEQLSLIKK